MPHKQPDIWAAVLERGQGRVWTRGHYPQRGGSRGCGSACDCPQYMHAKETEWMTYLYRTAKEEEELIKETKQ